MKKTWYWFLVLAGFGINTATYAQGEFDTSKIKPELLKDADAVIRFQELIYDIQSPAEAREQFRQVVTILDEAGEEIYREHMVPYDKLNRVSDISGVVYDATGKPIKRIKNADIKDYSDSDDGYTDNRVKLIEFGKKNYSYPYTVEISYDLRTKNMMFFPSWQPYDGDRTSVEKSTFIIKVSDSNSFRYKEKNGAKPAEKSRDKEGKNVYQWSLSDQAVVKPVPFSLPVRDLYPMVVAAPSAFELQGYSGSFTSWEDMSRFYYTLNMGRDILPKTTIDEIKVLLTGAKTGKEKVSRIYKWMQGRTRYYSIQLGIGGWQTIDAATVATKGYGDCKALTNFTLACLKEAGVQAYGALIRAGKEKEINTEFPASQFNHIIACAIADKDTVWLECTNQTNPPGYLGSFTGNRHALLVMPKGGKLVSTPTYGSIDNSKRSNSQVALDDAGKGKIVATTIYSGLQQEYRKGLIENLPKDQQKKWLVNNINLPSLDLTAFDLVLGYANGPIITETLEMNAGNLAGKTGARLFLKPAIMTRSMELPVAETRTVDFYLPLSTYNFDDRDSLTFLLPEGYNPETKLPEAQVSSQFGEYQLTSSQVENKVIYQRRLTMKGGRYDASLYPAWIDFLKAIRKADRTQIVLVKK